MKFTPHFYSEMNTLTNALLMQIYESPEYREPFRLLDFASQWTSWWILQWDYYKSWYVQKTQPTILKTNNAQIYERKLSTSCQKRYLFVWLTTGSAKICIYPEVNKVKKSKTLQQTVSARQITNYQGIHLWYFN